MTLANHWSFSSLAEALKAVERAKKRDLTVSSPWQDATGTWRVTVLYNA